MKAIWLPLLSASLAAPASAADLISAVAQEPAIVAENGWTFSVTPYFWGARLSGDLSQFGLPVVGVDASFGDVLENLDLAAMVIAEARYGRYSIFGDILYTRLGAEADTPLGVLATSADVDASTFAGLAGAGYSVIDGPSGRLDVVGAVRVWSVDAEISFNGGPLGGQSFGDGAAWVDGLIGVRGNYSITPKLFVVGWALIGAGGADIDWDVAGGIGYHFSDRYSAALGYRALGVDYSEDGFLFDVVQQGPIMGLTIRF